MATKKVTLCVDKSFFNNVFEPSRKKTQKQLGLSNLSQPKFTKMLAKSGFKIEVKLKKIPPRRRI